MYTWTSEDIEQILIQLDAKELPFKKYSFKHLGEGLHLLGKGASANVYKAEDREKGKHSYAIKVIGFSGKHLDSAEFYSSVEEQIILKLSNANIVKTYAYTELRVWIEDEHTVVDIEEVDIEEDKVPVGNYISLQFIVMEEITPIVLGKYRGRPQLFPGKLASFDEREILKLAYDISSVLNEVHKMNLIHRDLKLENIFYSIEKKCYKLGDFGIARKMEDGFASTVAFTKGYGAPEVICSASDKYDNTADIYSLGMVLYLLLNDLRFPQSKSYHVNLAEQYGRGYIPPLPSEGADEFRRVVIKMCSYDPDERYQSMKEVLNELDRLMYGTRIKVNRKHNSAAVAMGTVCALFGAAFWSLSFAPEICMNFDMWLFLLLVLGGLKALTIVLKKYTMNEIVNVAIFGVGIYMLIVHGFMWSIFIIWILLLCLEAYSGIVAIFFFVAQIAGLVTGKVGIALGNYSELKWLAITLISLSIILLFQYAIVKTRDKDFSILYLKKGKLWIVVALLYLSLILHGYTMENRVNNPNYLLTRILGLANVKLLLSYNFKMIGRAGLCFCGMWIGRELILMFKERQKEKKAIADMRDTYKYHESPKRKER